MRLQRKHRTPIERAVLLIDDLLAGKTHDRWTIAYRLGIEMASADRYTLALAKLRGVVVERRRLRKIIRYEAPRKQGASA